MAREGNNTRLGVVKHRTRELALARRREQIALGRFNTAVVSAYKAGHSMTDIGETAGISHQRVSQIVEESEIAKLRAG